MKRVCDVCGNESASPGFTCPFCGARVDEDKARKDKRFVEKVVNLEAGRPVVELAMNRMVEIIDDSIRNNVNVITLIHGYGSSGKGGAIRSECRKTLDFLKSKGRIWDYITGENFNKRSGTVKSLLQRYPQLGSNKNLNRGNRGITLVIFSSVLLWLHAFVCTSAIMAMCPS